MAQVQCPNCGGYRTQQKYLYTTKDLGFMGWVYGIGVYVLGFALFGYIFEWTGQGAIFCVSSVWMLGAPFVIGSVIRSTNQSMRKVVMSDNEYGCELCGYKFDIRPVDRSKIKVRPDLIAKGEKRLDEERRRRLLDD